MWLVTALQVVVLFSIIWSCDWCWPAREVADGFDVLS